MNVTQAVEFTSKQLIETKLASVNLLVVVTGSTGFYVTQADSSAVLSQACLLITTCTLPYSVYECHASITSNRKQ